MALNKNHEFEELNGIKCGIVEENVSPERVEFLRKLLEFNRFEVIVVPSAAPKPAASPKPQAASQPTADQSAVDQSAVEQPAASSQQPEQSQPEPQPPPPPQTFSVGVTDTTFNPINAIF